MAISVLSKENNPLINIITRTNSRPNAFARCRHSIAQQTYKNIRHIVCVDREEDMEYVLQHDNIDVFPVNINDFSNLKDIPDPKTGGRFPYNLYFNYLISQITDGWVMILDDDDYLNDAGVIETIAKTIQYETDMILWQMQYPNGIKLPADYELNNKPMLARIGAPCIAIHHSNAKKIKWDGWKCGDFRYIDRAWNITNIKRWIRRPLIQIGTNGGGLGRRQDIERLMLPNMKSTHKKTEPAKPKQIINQKVVKFENRKLAYYDFIIGISTYNRFDHIVNLIAQIENQFKLTTYSYKIIVMNDHSSDSRYDTHFLNNKQYVYLKNHVNFKKENYWQTINKLFSSVKTFDYKYFIQLDDDYKLCDNFFDTIIEEFKNSSPKTVAISLGLVAEEIKSGRGRWGYKNFLDGGGAYKKAALELLNYNILPIPKTRFRVNHKISSGVWTQVTKRLNKYSTDAIKNPRYALVHHQLFNDSKMNSFRNNDQKLYKMIKTVNFEQSRVPIVMCTWKRFEKLKTTLDLLEKQTNKAFSFNIWNNNTEYVEPINKLLESSSYSYPIFVHHSDKNVGGFGRFYYAEKLANMEYDKVIFIDDDQTFGPNLIDTFLSEYEPKTIKSRWAWYLKTKYWDRVKVDVNSTLEPKYCGTNGMICDIEVFKDKNLFKCPEEFWFIEDLWLSYFARIVHNYKLGATSVVMEVKDDGKDQFRGLINKKDTFYFWLEENFTKNNYQNFLNEATTTIPVKH